MPASPSGVARLRNSAVDRVGAEARASTIAAFLPSAADFRPRDREGARSAANQRSAAETVLVTRQKDSFAMRIIGEGCGRSAQGRRADEVHSSRGGGRRPGLPIQAGSDPGLGNEARPARPGPNWPSRRFFRVMR